MGPGFDPRGDMGGSNERLDLKLVHGWLAKGERPSRDVTSALSRDAQAYSLNFGSLVLQNGIVHLMWIGPEGANSGIRKLVPSSLRPQVLRSCHDSKFAAHMGVNKTTECIWQRFFWPGLRGDVKLHIRSCPTCAASKGAYRRFRASLADSSGGSSRPSGCGPYGSPPWDFERKPVHTGEGRLLHPLGGSLPPVGSWRWARRGPLQ